jgi:hypothetical protein
MNTIIIETKTEKEYKIYRDILAMIETAKIHGFAEIKIKIQDHDILQGSVTLDTRW